MKTLAPKSSTPSKVKEPKTFRLTLEMTEPEYEALKQALVSLWISFEFDAVEYDARPVVA